MIFHGNSGPELSCALLVHMPLVPRIAHIKLKKCLIYFLQGRFVVLKNNLNGFWDFYNVTKVGACLPKVSSCIYVQGPGCTRTHTGTIARDIIHWVCAVQCRYVP
jgi:hypothetical protein